MVWLYKIIHFIEFVKMKYIQIELGGFRVVIFNN